MTMSKLPTENILLTEIRVTSVWEWFGTERIGLGQKLTRNHSSNQILQTTVFQCPGTYSHSLLVFMYLLGGVTFYLSPFLLWNVTETFNFFTAEICTTENVSFIWSGSLLWRGLYAINVW